MPEIWETEKFYEIDIKEKFVNIFIDRLRISFLAYEDNTQHDPLGLKVINY